ncbi:spore germination protein [Bacillus sp. AFS017336]|uniref:spore germination protein n=1 Tax=Bacillus sp. AFS017336 TaxID=2033489 RepID=UPI000BF13E14|nr:spore germination protein [Bacillus sp. AFS017336]PEK98190.1 hypothetical protein CN601_26130 [Bacillus sp. AFS017336]
MYATKDADFSSKLEQVFQSAVDFQKRIVIENAITLYYLETIVKTDDIQRFVIEPLQQKLINDYKHPLSTGKIPSVISSLSCKEVSDYNEVEEGLLDGFTFICLKGKSSGLLVATQDWKERSIEEVYGERSIKGPINGFTENIQINLNMLRNTLRTPELAIETKAYGEKSKTLISIVYLKDTVDQAILKTVKNRIEDLSVKYILESRVVQDALEGRPPTFFNLLMTTDRVEQTSSSLLEGKVVVFVDRNPQAIIAPSLLVDFVQSADDFHMKSVHILTRPLRIISSSMAFLLPGVYVTLAKFHQNDFGHKYAKMLFNDKEILPTYIEVLILTLLLKILFDLGSAAPRGTVILLTFVATISIGETSVSANLIHPVGLVVASLSAFLSFSIGLRGQVAAMNYVRFLYILVGNFTDFKGLIVLSTVLILYITQLKSVGVPFLSPFIPFQLNEFQDVFFRENLRKLNNKNHSFPNVKTDK